jgi:hypothetical protein
MAGTSKFDELRLKTDRQLIQIANTELDLGIRDAHRALESAENWVSAERHYWFAERAHAQTSLLLHLAGDSREAELGSVESRLEYLLEILDGLSVLESTATPAQDTTSALARALWKARGCPEGLPEEDWFRAERALKLHTACVGS